MKPYVIVHNQVSLDGRIDWFPIDPGLFYEVATHWKEDATLAGTDTLMAALDQFGDTITDNGTPTDNASGPLLVVPDSQGRIKHWELLLSTPFWSGGVALCTKTTPEKHLEYLDKTGVEYAIVGDDKVNFSAALSHLADRYGIRKIRVDSGGALNGVLLRNGLVDEVSLLISPHLVGGLTPKSLFRAPDLTEAGKVIALQLTSVEKLRDGVVWLRYIIQHQEEAT